MKQLLSFIVFYLISQTLIGQSASHTKTVVSSSCWATNNVIATSTQQNAIVAYDNFVYLAFYNTDRKLSIARNSNFGEGDEWLIIELPHTYEMRNGTWDNHNTPNIAISPNDGRIHLSFDMHARNLRYIISSENAATIADEEFKSDLFSPTRDYLESNKQPLTKVTYPRFFLGEDDKLFFMYREGGSGNGNSYMAKYEDNGFWDRPFVVVNGREGSYDGSNNRCAYFNDVHFKDGRIYLTWVWRETPDGDTNHDVMFAYSDNNGESWKNSTGVTISGSMNLDSRGIKIATVPTGAGLSNHNGSTVDGHGNVHIVSRVGGSYIHHFGIRQGNSFKWHEATIATFSGDRPKFYCDQNTNDLYFMVRQGNQLRLFASASNDEKWDQWSEIANVNDLVMTSGNSYMNTSADLLTSMFVSSDNRLQVVRWSLSTNSQKIEKKEDPVVLNVELNNNLKVYPNPSPNGIYNLSTRVNYQIHDLSGFLIQEGRGSEINLESFPHGLYILRVDNQSIKVFK